MTAENQCRWIYKEAFCEPDTAFEDLLFENCFEYCKTLELEGEVVSMLFALPCEIEGEKAVYIFAAATKNQYRGKGYMSRLIKKLADECEDLIFLRPANEGLIKFYAGLGFLTLSASSVKGSISVMPKDGFKRLTEKLPPDQESEEFTVMFLNRKSYNRLYFPYSMGD